MNQMLPNQTFLWLPLSALALCAILHLAALKLFPRWNLLDFPERYGLSRKRLPYPTGILAIIVFLVFLAFLQEWNKQVIGLMLGILLLGGISFIDDRTPLPSSLRLLAQIIIAFIIFGTGTRIYSITNPFITDGIIKLDTIVFPMALFSDPPLWSGIFTIMWLVLTINAFNWFDGIPGQVSTLSVIGFLIIGFLSLSERVQQPELALIAFTLAGIAFACLLFDFPPPRVLMGDTGAIFFGLMLGVLTIYAGGKVATAFLVLGVPLIDSGIVILRRIAKWNSPFRGDTRNEHLHHRLLNNKGWSERQVILLTALLGSFFGVTAIFLSTLEKFVAAVVLFLIMGWLSWYSGNQSK